MSNETTGYDLSVIIPCYNVEKFIKRVIKSVVYQPSNERAEIIMVDDGSVDCSPNLCDESCLVNTSMMVLHQPNRGVSCSRNRAVQIAGGGISLSLMQMIIGKKVFSPMI